MRWNFQLKCFIGHGSYFCITVNRIPERNNVRTEKPVLAHSLVDYNVPWWERHGRKAPTARVGVCGSRVHSGTPGRRQSRSEPGTLPRSLLLASLSPPPNTTVRNLWVDDRSSIPDIYILINSSSKIIVMSSNEIILLFGVTTTCGTLLKCHSIRKVENHCPKGFHSLQNTL